MYFQDLLARTYNLVWSKGPSRGSSNAFCVCASTPNSMQVAHMRRVSEAKKVVSHPPSHLISSQIATSRPPAATATPIQGPDVILAPTPPVLVAASRLAADLDEIA